MRRSFLLAILAVLCLLQLTAAFHGTPLPPAAKRPAPQQPLLQSQMKDQNYHPTMAYFEEVLRMPMPIYEAHWAVEQYHASGAYDRDLGLVLQNAQLHAQTLQVAENSAWVFDIDETTLSGYDQMLEIGFGYVPKLNKEWVMTASAPRIEPAFSLYEQLVNAGFKIIFMTGRPQDEADATALNLKRQGYTTYETLITRTPEERNLTATQYKTARRVQLVEQEGYNIVGCVGDQWSDLNGPYTGFKVKLPNLIYFLP